MRVLLLTNLKRRGLRVTLNGLVDHDGKETPLTMNKKTASVVLLSIVLFFGLFVIFRPMNARPSGYWTGLIIGIVLGVLTCFYMATTWETNSDKSHFSSNMLESRLRWMPIVVVIGLLVGRIVINLVTPEIEVLITNCVFSWFILVALYLVARNWSRFPQ